jgi:two-component system nitrogen regulation response regulator GlnG
MDRVLLIDDDAGLIQEQVRQAFPRPFYDVHVADTGSDGIASVRAGAPDVILLDLRLPDRSGLAVFEAIREIDARIPVIFVTTAKTADTAIEAMKQGAFDYLHKPLDLEQLQRVVDDALDVARRMRSPVRLADTASAQIESEVEGTICGSDPRMLEIYKAIGRVAAQDVTVLITGESGTGKELVARAIYQHSGRAQAPFFVLNCAAIPEHLIESELFGHEKGAFTGADRRRIGKFEQYSGGTILLDEIGDMPLHLQAKILRLLQDQSFERVGGTETLHSNVRVLASTHRDVRAWAAEDRFRSDLYYRLSVFTIHLPPLRDRRADLEQLVRHYVSLFGRSLHRDVREISPEALERLRAYPWPGNIRERHGAAPGVPAGARVRTDPRRQGPGRSAARSGRARPGPDRSPRRRHLRGDPSPGRSAAAGARARAHRREPARGRRAGRDLAADDADQAARARVDGQPGARDRRRDQLTTEHRPWSIQVVVENCRSSAAHSSSRSIGLDRKSSIPASRQRARSRLAERAVNAMIGRCRPVVRSRSRIARTTSNPSISGMCRSSSSTSNVRSIAAASAARPSPTMYVS